MSEETRLMIDGFQGSLYDIAFPVPTYDNSTDTFNTSTWREIDLFYNSNASSTVLNTFAFAICVVSFVYVLALTPANKRRHRIHSCLVLALVFKMIDRGAAISLLLHSPNVSAYINLTLDYEHIIISNSFKARVIVLQTGAILTFVFLQACLYLHGKPLMTSLKLHSRMLYLSTLTYLILAGILALVMRITLAMMVLSNLDIPLGPSGSGYIAIYNATLITFAISIGSWSLVFFITAMTIILRRRKQMISRNKLYESVLNLIAIIGLESFILPLFFALFQIVPRINTLLSNSPEVLLIPSVLLVLPLASMFGSSRVGHSRYDASGLASSALPLQLPLSSQPPTNDKNDPTSGISVSTSSPQNNPYSMPNNNHLNDNLALISKIHNDNDNDNTNGNKKNRNHSDLELNVLDTMNKIETVDLKRYV